VVAYRTALDPDAPTAAIDNWVERLTRDVDFVAEQARWTSSPASELDFQGDVEQLATYARQLMNVDSVEPIPHLADAALTVCVVIFSPDLGLNAPEAASAPADTWGVAVVNGSLKVGRRRLAAAHGLGHLSAGDGYRV